jgi:hypothetical protein
MDEFNSLGQNSFWVKWSKNGVRCHSTNILRGLKEERCQRNDALANEADFELQFAYKKGHKYGVCARNSSIARRYGMMKVVGP